MYSQFMMHGQKNIKLWFMVFEHSQLRKVSLNKGNGRDRKKKEEMWKLRTIICALCHIISTNWTEYLARTGQINNFYEFQSEITWVKWKREKCNNTVLDETNIWMDWMVLDNYGGTVWNKIMNPRVI